MEQRTSTGPFDGMFAAGRVAAIVQPRAWVQAMLDVESAIAHSAAEVGLVSTESAHAVQRAATADGLDMELLAGGTACTGNPVVALVQGLRARLPADARAAVHIGATSQDVIDTASVLIQRQAAAAVLDDLEAAAAAAARLARRHRADLMLGRTLMQPAVPITFGFKAAGWCVALDDGAEALAAAAVGGCVLQYGGAVGTLASLTCVAPQSADAMVAALASRLNLRLPTLPWHTHRLPILQPAMGFGAVGATAGKVARDVLLMAQGEIRELREGPRPGRGGSSTMPHKDNPVAAVAVVACCARLPGLVATLLSCASQEHERGAGGWHAEWETRSDLFRLTGAAVAWLRDLLEHVEVDPMRMLHNLVAMQDLPLAEQLRTWLVERVPRERADELAAEAVAEARAASVPLGTVLTGRLATRLVAAGVDPEQAAAALDPGGYLGSCDAMVERALGRRARRSETFARERLELGGDDAS